MVTLEGVGTERAAPLVSVVIPCYRQAQFLSKAVTSCLDQTYSPVEIIVVNDGSDDDTDIAARAYEGRILYLSQPNRGVSAARNAGVAAASGKFVKFLDADDHLHADQIAWQVDALNGLQHAVALTAVRRYQHTRPADFEDHIPRAKALLPDLLNSNELVGIHGFLFPRDLVLQVGGFDESRDNLQEDWDFHCRMGLLEPSLVVDPRIGAYYRTYPGSRSANGASVAITRARLLIALHDRIRDCARTDWFGRELLEAEQDVYRRLLMLGVCEPQIASGLLQRMGELRQAGVHAEPAGRWFALLSATFGYACAEFLRAAILRRSGPIAPWLLNRLPRRRRSSCDAALPR